MQRAIITVIIIAAVLFLFGQARQQGSQLVGGATGGPRLGGPTNPTSALPPGYRYQSSN